MTESGIGFLLRLLIAVTLPLLVGLIAAAVLHRRRGPHAATFVQRAALLALIVGIVVSALPIPRPPRLLVAAVPALREVSRAPGPTAAVVAVARPATLSVPAPPPPHTAFSPEHLPRLLAGLYVVGVMIGLLRLLLAHAALIRLRRRTRPTAPAPLLQETAASFGVRPPDVWEPAAAGPFLAGVLRPVLYLPPNFSLDAENARAIFVHEIAHLQRWDLQWNLLVRILRVLLWCHPLIHLCARQMETVAEAACDEWVIQQGRISPRVYADLLLRLAEKKNAAASTFTLSVASSRRSALSERIEQMLKNRPARPLTPPMKIAVGALIFVLTLSSTLLFGPSIKAAQNSTPPESEIKQKAEPLMTMELQEVTLRDALDRLFQQAGNGYRYEIAQNPDVSGIHISLKTTDVPFGQALDLILRSSTTPLIATRSGNTFQILPAPLFTRDWKNQDLRAALLDLSREAKVPFLIAPEVQGTVSVAFRAQPLQTALSLIQEAVRATPRPISWSQEGGKITIKPGSRSAPYQQPPLPKTLVSLNASNMPLRTALENILTAARSDFSIDPSVNGTVTIRFRELPLDNALNRIKDATQGSFVWERKNGVVILRGAAR